jgi:hypothetical protein
MHTYASHRRQACDVNDAVVEKRHQGRENRDPKLEPLRTQRRWGTHPE